MASDFDLLPQAKKFHAPLQPGDTDERTVGCRHTSPDICRNNGLHSACAFVRSDGMCEQPPRSWAKQFRKLEAADESQGGAA